jgi:RNA polymerase sigma factor (sigma-70 family)
MATRATAEIRGSAETTVVIEQFDTVLDAARAGADWAWARLYDALAPSILGYLRARGAVDPEAVCGDVFCQLVRDLHRFEGDETGFRSWVFVIAHHRLLDDLRRRRRRPESLASPEAFGTIEDSFDVAHDVVTRSRELEIRRLLDDLTPAQRDVLLLRIFGGLTVIEVARAVGRRPGAVKALQRRGLEMLRRRLEGPPLTTQVSLS